MTGHYLDLESWPRRSHFQFFKHYELPFFGICAEVPVTETLQWCRDHKLSFSLACWFACLQTINAIPEFRYRIRGDKVWVHEQIDVGTTMLNDDETFSFRYFSYSTKFKDFCGSAKAATDLEERADNDALIHGSTLPWVRFTGLTHARRIGQDDSVPKVAFGRYAKIDNAVTMPVSLEVHHALMDGLHASRFFQQLEQRFSDPKTLLS
ncbi:MAG: CatA-like O-acetyltransferase [Planctomycetota bacterium]|nr:CatA-like O-acetyltransferase [Planctomycetota bacterium]